MCKCRETGEETLRMGCPGHALVQSTWGALAPGLHLNVLSFSLSLLPRIEPNISAVESCTPFRQVWTYRWADGDRCAGCYLSSDHVISAPVIAFCRLMRKIMKLPTSSERLNILGHFTDVCEDTTSTTTITSSLSNHSWNLISLPGSGPELYPLEGCTFTSRHGIK
jgi:hypothetical protein